VVDTVGIRRKATNAVAQETDYDLVAKTVNYYLEGGNKNDYQTLKKAFHETATMTYSTK